MVQKNTATKALSARDALLNTNATWLGTRGKMKDKFYCITMLIALVFIILFSAGLHFGYIQKDENIPYELNEESIDCDYSIYVQGTGSMKPTIMPHDKVYLEKVHDVSGLEVGKIYVYTNENTGKKVIHRLVYIDGGYCFFKGDNNFYLDNKINCSQVYSKLVAVGKE